MCERDFGTGNQEARLTRADVSEGVWRASRGGEESGMDMRVVQVFQVGQAIMRPLFFDSCARLCMPCRVQEPR